MLKRTQQYHITSKHPLYAYCNELCSQSKNLYNAAHYLLRQSYILVKRKELLPEQQQTLQEINQWIALFNEKSLKLFPLSKAKKLRKLEKDIEVAQSKSDSVKVGELMGQSEKIEKSQYKPHPLVDKQHTNLSYDFLNFYFADVLQREDNPYRHMPVQAAQQTLRGLSRDWKSYFEGLKAYKKCPTQFTGKPQLIRYKKKNGKHLATLTNQNCKLKGDYLTLPFTKTTLKHGIKEVTACKLKEVRIVPTGTSYTLEVIYDWDTLQKEWVDNQRVIGIDIGVSNFATVVNNIGEAPFIIDGKPIKKINQNYNKIKAKMQSELPIYKVKANEKEEKRQGKHSKRLSRFTLKRNARIKDFMHKASRQVIQYCLKYHITKIVVGKNTGWKQGVQMGKVNNQTFTSIPFATFIKMLTYKGEAVGIQVLVGEESYTSKASFLDKDEIPVYDKSNPVKYTFSGRRITRGMYRTKSNIELNADVNSAYNIVRKYCPEFKPKEVMQLKWTPKKINVLVNSVA